MNNSTDEYKSYLKVIFITVFSILLFLIPITYKALFIDKIFSHKNLWEYQMSRLDSNPDIDTLFLGDSSLRYAIDSDYFNSISGLNSINLGLTLNHGFAGSYNVLKRAINKNQIKNVIIVNTIEILKTEISYKGYFHSINSIDDLVSLSQNEKSKILAVIFSIFTNKDNLKKIFNFYLHKDVSLNFFTEEDLRPKKEKIDLKTFQNYRAWDDRVFLRKTLFLEKIIDLCEKEGINLIYMHGPVSQTILNGSEEYVSRLNQIIGEKGLKLISGVPEITYKKIGNKSNHISKEYRKEFTKKYFELMKKNL